MASPLLLLPHPDQENNILLFDLELETSFDGVNGLKNLPRNHQCVGSSHGWLSFLDENSNPYLFNPFSNTRICLPETHTIIRRGPRSGPYVPKINEIVLTRDPTHYDSYVVVAMYSVLCQTGIAFCTDGDEEWNRIRSGLSACYDIFCCDRTNTVYLLGSGPTVVSWDFRQSVRKMRTNIQDSCPRKLMQAREIYPNDLYASNWYLVRSPLGEMYLVARYIGEFVRYDGEVVHEADTLTDYAAEPLVCPYRTVDFHVYKVDYDQKEWVEVKCFDGFSMFLGQSQSMMVWAKDHQGLKKNCIYFTDDYLDRMNEDYTYGGHDMGVFDMEDGSIEPILECQEGRIEPPPIWITVPKSFSRILDCD